MIAMTAQTPRILEGPAPAVAMSSLGEFIVRGNGSSAERLEALKSATYDPKSHKKIEMISLGG